MDTGEVLPTRQPSREEIAAFVGRNHHVYAACWRPALDGSSRWCGFNVGAAVLNWIWFVYRGMYREAVVVFLVLAGIGFSLDRMVVGDARVPSFVQLWVLWSFGIGMAANWWYLRRLREAVAQAPTDLTPAARMAWLARQGGTSTGLAIAAWAFHVGVRWLARQ